MKNAKSWHYWHHSHTTYGTLRPSHIPPLSETSRNVRINSRRERVKGKDFGLGVLSAQWDARLKGEPELGWKTKLGQHRIRTGHQIYDYTTEEKETSQYPSEAIVPHSSEINLWPSMCEGETSWALGMPVLELTKMGQRSMCSMV